MAKIVFDQAGKRYYEMGVKYGVIYLFDKETGTYPIGVAWNGLTSVSESPEGAEATDIWADDIKYASFRSTETFKGTIEAYTYPKEFEACDGTAEIAPGVTIGQQARSMFGLVYRTSIGSDNDPERSEYKLHIVYGCTVSPSEKTYETINDSPDAITFSWEFDTTPVDVAGYKPTSNITIDSREIAKDKLQLIEDALYGTDDTEAHLPMPGEIITMLAEATDSADA